MNLLKVKELVHTTASTRNQNLNSRLSLPYHNILGHTKRTTVTQWEGHGAKSQ